MEENLKKQYKEKILEVLKYSISFFNKHDISWFIACGSAIGAVRHKGIIPWDDDIDIYMPREDYNKLFSVRDEMLSDGYRFICMKDKGYPLAFGKISDNNTTVIENRRLPFNVGCYIDVFPLDLTNRGMMSFGNKWMSFRMEYMKYRAKISRITIKGVFDDIKNKKNDTIKVIPMKLALLFRSREKMLEQLLDMEASWNTSDGDRYVSFTESGMYMFPKEWFEKYIVVPFEDLNVRLPKFYDEYLTYIYGDYMKLPPIEERVGDGIHGKYYVNLWKNIIK